MIIYEIERGDTLYNLANFFGTTVNEIARVNNIDPNNNLVIGQAITIPVDNVEYTIMAGDTLYSIARRYGVSVEDIYKTNPNLKNSSLIFPGQVIVIPYSVIKPYDVTVNGYMLPMISNTILDKTLPYLDYLSIFSYEVMLNGDLRPVVDEQYIKRANSFGVEPLMTITNIGGEGFNADIANELFTNTQVYNNFVNNVLNILNEKGYLGVNIDFEYLNPEDKDLYTQFLRNLAQTLKQNGYIMAVAVAPKTSADQKGRLYEAHDYKAIGEIADLVIIMTYEWGYLFGDPQAISPINKITEVIDYAVTEIPNNKILLGVSNYAYDWTLPYVKGQPAKILSNEQALNLARQKGSNIMFDTLSQSPYFTYNTNTNQHIVWFEDVRSLYAKLELVKRYNLKGISYWNINYFINPSGLLDVKSMGN